MVRKFSNQHSETNLSQYSIKMKRRIYIAAVSLAVVAGASAQNKLDYPAQRMMEAYQSLNSHTGDDNRVAYGESDRVVTALVTLKSAGDAARLEDRGYEIIDLFDDIAMVDIKLSDVEALCAEDYIVHVSFGGEAVPMMDKARAASNVDAVQAGTDLKMPYTGKGVIVSLYDTGLDPNHITFMNEDGESRVLAIDQITGTAGTEARFTTATQIAKYTTDKASETHGTHVLGIMTGAYRGESEMNRTTGDNPYYGCSPDADIIIGCGDLYNNNILKAVKYIRDCAELLEQPAVINLSLGSTAGSHDGSSSFNKALANYGKDAVIVVAAGNDGDLPMGVRHTFTEDEPELATSIVPYFTSSGQSVASRNFNGTVTFIANDKTPFTLTIGIANSRGVLSSEYVIDSSTSGRSTTINDNNLTGFGNAYGAGSSLAVSTNVDTAAQKYMANISFNLDTTPSSQRYILVFIIEAEEGKTVNGYVNGSGDGTNGYRCAGAFSGRGVDGWTDGSCNGSINDMACGENTICIGSYNTRKSWKTIQGSNAGYSYIVEGDISDFSSYGTLVDGRNLPDVCAPGCYILSAWSRFNISGGYASASSMVALTTENGIPNYWGPMQGTSMATPFAAGVFASWLEADPTLTVNDIRDIAVTTAKRDSYVDKGDPVQWGAGKLDAYAGVKEVLRRADAGVNDILADNSSDKLIVEALGENQYLVSLVGANVMTGRLYGVNGMLVKSIDSDGDALTVDCSSMAGGVYVLAVESAGGVHTTKIVVK